MVWGNADCRYEIMRKILNQKWNLICQSKKAAYLKCSLMKAWLNRRNKLMIARMRFKINNIMIWSNKSKNKSLIKSNEFLRNIRKYKKCMVQIWIEGI